MNAHNVYLLREFIKWVRWRLAVYMAVAIIAPALLLAAVALLSLLQ